MRYNRLVLLLLAFTMLGRLTIDARTISLYKNINLQKQLASPNATYVVNDYFDLKGASLIMPKGSTLMFIRGSLNNGNIVGDSSRIFSDKRIIFRNISIYGSWNNDTVYSDWLDFSQDSLYDNRNNFQNLTTLCNGNNHTEVFIKKGTYWSSTKDNEYAILIPSNTTWNCKATIKVIPNSLGKAPFVKVYKAKNVVINGGTYIGDLRKHIGNKGEWSHGIECRASSNVTIKNVVCKEFWGDGIDVIDGYDDKLKPTMNNYDVTIENVNCLYNRRAGIGLEAVINCKVINCECRFTGQIRGTLPMTGIGVESWSKEGEKIKNVEISNCVFEDNKDQDLYVYANGPWRDDFAKYENNIVVRGCTIGYFFVSHTNGITLDNCEIKKSKGYEYTYVKGLNYVNSTIKGRRIHKIVNKLPKK